MLCCCLHLQPVSAKVIRKLRKFKTHNKNVKSATTADAKSIVSYASKKSGKGKKFSVLVVDDSQYETECITQMCAESNFESEYARPSPSYLLC